MKRLEKREIEQLVEGSRKCGKVEDQRGTLVLCFELPQETRSSYIFEFFRINDLVGGNSLNKPPFYDDNTFMDDKSSKKPIQTLHWDASSSDIDLPYFGMSFLHTCSSDSSGGVLYAVGGVTPDDLNKIQNRIDDQPFSLPAELTPIPLPTGGNTVLVSKVDRKLAAMKSGKFFPLIVEIDGLIYVLSGYPPSLIKKPSSTPPAAQEEGEEYYWFEVYDPQKDAWEQLDDPPFANSCQSVYSSPFFEAGKYLYFVVGSKLHVSDGIFACVYDTESREWKASNLFKQHYLDKKPRGRYIQNTLTKWEFFRLCGWGLDENCGLGFPFHGQPILFDEKEKIFLCMKKVSMGKPPVKAFKICGDSVDGEKAVSIPLFLSSHFWPFGYPWNLVDLGQGEVALLIHELPEDSTPFYVTLFTFKLEPEFDDGVDGISTPCRLIATSLRVCYRKPLERLDLDPAYCFRM